MSLIRKAAKRPVKEILSVRMEPSVKALLDQYCLFAQSGRQHIVQEALLIAFEQDREFQLWLERNGAPSVETIVASAK